MLDPEAWPRRVVIMGAAGRDFHNFNVFFRGNPAYRVLAFTATQIPGISGRNYPASLAGDGYSEGIPIRAEADLAQIVRDEAVDDVVFAYSDVPHVEVMHRASVALAAGASFVLLGPRDTMLRAEKPVVSVCAVRTGCGKSPVSRWVLRWFKERGYRVAVIRHPMPYGDLEEQAVQRFASAGDLDRAETTIEEREEYEPYIELGGAIYAGVDYARILEQAQSEADVVLWDGGNNDFPFIRPDLHFVLLDPHRAGHERLYHPGETNLRMADALIVTKVDSATRGQVDEVIDSAREARPGAPVILGALDVNVDRPERIRHKRVVVVEDGPTLTHGGMPMGAGSIAAKREGAAEVVDARPSAVGSIAETFARFAHLTGEVPAMGYSAAQIRDLEATLRAAPADVVLDATPVNLAHLLDPGKPIVNVRYEFAPRGAELEEILVGFEARHLRSAGS